MPLSRCRGFLPGLILPRDALVRDFRPLDRYLNDHLVRLRREITRDRSSKDSSGTILAPDLCSFLHANDCELTFAIVTLLRAPTTLRPYDSRDALKSIDCHSLRRERNAFKGSELKVKAHFGIFYSANRFFAKFLYKSSRFDIARKCISM